MDNGFEALKNAIHADPDYAWGWQCNLAVPIMETVAKVTHSQANAAAAFIMRQVFDYDITTHPNFHGYKSAAQSHFEALLDAERNETPTS